MTIEVAFSIFSTMALLGWVVLIGFPRWLYGRKYVAGLIIPGIFAAAYAYLFPALYFTAPGGYGSLEDVLTLINSDPRIGLAAWLHYLAFDLLIGTWIAGEAQRIGIKRMLVVPALVLCFLFGPVGWAVFQVQKAVRSYRLSSTKA